jgi:hypothetical protein
MGQAIAAQLNQVDIACQGVYSAYDSDIGWKTKIKLQQ